MYAIECQNPMVFSLVRLSEGIECYEVCSHIAYPRNPDTNASSIIGIDWIIIAVTSRVMKPKKSASSIVASIAFIWVFLGLDEGIYTQDKKQTDEHWQFEIWRYNTAKGCNPKR